MHTANILPSAHTPYTIDETGTITTYPGARPGPVILISTYVHGNEVVGDCVLQTAHNLLSSGQHAGTYILLVANPQAREKGVRYCDEDMNRCWHKIDAPETIETKRAAYIAHWFREHDIMPDYVYDIHSAPSKSLPTIICDDTPETRTLSSLFSIPYRVCGLLQTIDGTSLLMYFLTQGSQGLAFETGDHTSEETLQEGVYIVETIIAHHNGQQSSSTQHIAIEGNGPVNKEQVTICITDMYLTCDPHCTFTDAYQGFEIIPPHTTRCRDAEQTLTTGDKEKIIFLPNTMIARDLHYGPRTRIAYLADRMD